MIFASKRQDFAIRNWDVLWTSMHNFKKLVKAIWIYNPLVDYHFNGVITLSDVTLW